MLFSGHGPAASREPARVRMATTIPDDPSATSARHEGSLLGRPRVAAGARARRPSATAATPRASRCARPRGRAWWSTPAPASASSARSCAEGEAGQTDVHLLISHTHWDHIQGLPYFSPLYQRGQQAVGLRAQARRSAPAGGVRLADRRSLLPGPVRRGPGRDRLPRADRRGQVRDLRRQGRLRAAQPPLHRHGLPADRSTARRWSTCRTRRRSATSCSRTSSSSGRRRRAPSCPATDRAEAGARCARAWCGCARAPTWSSTTRCSPPTTTGASRTTATRARATRSTSAARRARSRLVLFHHAPERSDAEIDAHPGRRARAGRAGRRRPGGRPRPTRGSTSRSVGRELMEICLLGRARVDSGAGAGDGSLRRQHLVRLAAHAAGGGLIVLDCGTGARNLGMSLMDGRVRPGARRGEHPAVARPLGPHPGVPVLRAALPPGQQVPHLRRRQELGDAGGDPRGADGAAVLPGADAQEHGRRDRHRRHRRGEAVPGRGLHGAGAHQPARARGRAGVPDRGRRRARSSTPATPATARAARPRRRSSSTAAPTC